METVRVRIKPCGWGTVGDNVFVDQLINGEWVVRWSTSEMSNGNAYSEANLRALSLQKELQHV